jgi:hypothetical protein
MRLDPFVKAVRAPEWPRNGIRARVAANPEA